MIRRSYKDMKTQDRPNLIFRPLMAFAVGAAALFTTLFTPFSAQARSSVGSVGVKLVVAAKVGFGPNKKRLQTKRFGKWIAPIRSRIKSCFKLGKRKGVLKATCVKIKLVEFQ